MKWFWHTDDNGGLKLRSDDVRWLQQGLADAIAGLAQLNGETTYFIEMPVFTTAGGTTSYTDGLVVINGEVCVIDAGSFNSAYFNIYLETDESFDAAGDKPFFAIPGTHQTYRILKGKITSYAAPQVGLTSIAVVKDRSKILSEIIAAQINDFSKTQSFGKGTINSWIMPNLTLNADGNTYDLNFANGDELKYLSNPLAGSPGTVIRVHLIGATSTSTITVKEGGNIYTPGHIDFLFRHDDILTFVADTGSYWRLQGRANSSYTPVTCAPSTGFFTSGFAPGFKRTSDNCLIMRGTVATSTLGANTSGNVMFMLPAGIRPARNYDIVRVNEDGVYKIRIATSGAVSYQSVTVSSATTIINLEGVVFDLD